MKYMSRICSLILALTVLVTCASVALAARHPFADVPDGTYYSEPVAFCYTSGLMNGTGPTVFQPELEMSRAMLVTVLYRMDGSRKVNGSVPFTDVASDAYYADAVAWAYKNEVVNGTSPTTFSPNTNITREQMVTIFYRYAKYKGKDVSAAADLSGYSDSGKVGSYAKAAFRWSVACGIVNGISATQLSPAGTATRAQCATIIKRFFDWTQPGNPNSPTETPHTHEFKAGEVVTPTCEAEGYTIYTCSCGESQNRDSIPATGHAWSRWLVTKEPTWEDAGEKTRACALCGKSETAAVAKLSDAHAHTYEYWEFVDPTCISEGYEYRTCIKCGHTEYGATFKPIDHSWGEWVTTKEPTTTEEGSANRVCSVCSAADTKTLPKHVHSYGDWIKVDSTCTEDGYYYQECECGYSETVETIAKKDHAYKMVASVDATCVAMGSETYECAACGDTYTKDLDMIEHSWIHEHTDEVGHWGDQILVCTCGWSCSENVALSAGFVTVGKYWSVHHKEYYSEIGATNDHSYTFVTLPEDWVIDTPAADIWTCSGCGASTTNHDEVTGHQMELTRDAFGSSCLRNNYDTYTCNICSYSFNCDYIDSHGHIWGDWEITEEITTDSRGWAIRSCTRNNCYFQMGDYADLVNEGQHYHSYKPESQTICIECGEDSIP